MVPEDAGQVQTVRLPDGAGKKVQVKNTGTVPTYARVRLVFPDADVEDISVVNYYKQTGKALKC